jgi:hypothetical protein
MIGCLKGWYSQKGGGGLCIEYWSNPIQKRMNDPGFTKSSRSKWCKIYPICLINVICHIAYYCYIYLNI